MAGVEGRQQHAAEGRLPEHHLPLLDRLPRRDVPTPHLVSGRLQLQLVARTRNFLVDLEFVHKLEVVVVGVLAVVGLQPRHLVAERADILHHGRLLVLRQLGVLQRAPAGVQLLLALAVVPEPGVETCNHLIVIYMCHLMLHWARRRWSLYSRLRRRCNLRSGGCVVEGGEAELRVYGRAEQSTICV